MGTENDGKSDLGTPLHLGKRTPVKNHTLSYFMHYSIRSRRLGFMASRLDKELNILSRFRFS